MGGGVVAMGKGIDPACPDRTVGRRRINEEATLAVVDRPTQRFQEMRRTWYRRGFA
jgi:hypothetical protein